jgi:molecular chaperone GrpE
MAKKKEKSTGESAEVTPPAAANSPAEQTMQAELPEAQASEELNVALDGLKSELQAAQAKAGEYLDGWQRARAEFANYKKRTEREQGLAGQVVAGNIIKHFLEVVDDLDRALQKRPTKGEGAVWAEGIDLIYRKFLNVLEAEGVKRIEAEGQFFDPNQHEAISHEDHPELESGKVIGIVEQGFTYGDRVLRPARVRVAR